MNIRVIVNGAKGKMGQLAAEAIKKCPTLELVGETSRQDNLQKIIESTKANVVVDLTTAESAYENARIIIESNAHPVIGTTGFSPEHIADLKKRAAQKQLGGVIAPNFSITVVLMMRFATEAIQYLPHVEIIEMHHDNKKDAPSGTAIKTAEMMSASRKVIPPAKEEKILIPGARGGECKQIPIHSIRLPGLVAHQQIIFGGNNETLTLRQDTLHRESFMPGIILSCHKVMEIKELHYGLEHIL